MDHCMVNDLLTASPQLLLDIALCEAGFEPADQEQLEALLDPAQSRAMLDDMEARMGVNVSHVRRALAR